MRSLIEKDSEDLPEEILISIGEVA